jgi:PAS domain S-box-containing protein
MTPEPVDAAQLRLAAIVASSDDAIISKDLNGTITSWNAAAERIFGYTEAEAVGQSILLIVPPDLRHEEQEVLRRIRAGDSVDHYETTRIRKDGRRIEVSLTVSPLKTAEGNIIGASKIARDIGERKQLEIRSARLAAIVESSHDAIVGKTLDGTITSWNAAAERLFGYTSADVIGRSIRILIPDELQGEEDDVLSRIRRGQRVDHYDTVRRRKDGALIDVSLTVSPVLNTKGIVIGASKIARDISDRKRAETERRLLLQTAQEASRLKDEFLATLSHELRTPLNAILGYARMMRSGLLTGDKQTRAMETVVRNATSLTRIVEDVLDVARIVSGKIRLNMQTVDLPDVIAEAMETVRPASEVKGITIELTLDHGGARVFGDPERLQQIIWNLLSNAVKFTPQGGRIVVHLGQVGAHVEISVSDTGMGIPAEFLPHVFERFRQGDGGLTRVHGGLGLGLAITRHLVELQGGRISATSDGRGKGATFRVELPVRSAHGSRSIGERDAPAMSDAVGEIEVPALGGIRVLAVDDEPDALELMRAVLEVTGATVRTADSAEQALQAIEQAIPDLLIVDLGMPKMDGFALIERIRRSPDRRVRDLPAIAFTAYVRSEDRVKALRSGFQMHLAKPVDPGDLMAAVATLAKRASMRE